MSFYSNRYQQLGGERSRQNTLPTADVSDEVIEPYVSQSSISTSDYRAAPIPEYHIFRDVPDDIPLNDYHYPFPEDLVSDTSYKPNGQIHVTSKREHSRYLSNGPRKRLHFSGWLYRWWIEIAAFLLMAVAVTSTVVTLYLHQGKPLPQWPLKISINTLVAVYATVFKAAMLLITAEGLSELKWSWYHSKPRRLIDIARLDAASRGPWGSLLLLGTMRLKFLLASLGAFITLVGLGVDPFAQLVIQFRECTVASTNSTATIPRRNVYGYMGGHIGAGLGWLDSNMMSSIVAGAVNPAIVDAQCPSGNCDFPPYYSIGYCATCTDVTKNLTQKCRMAKNSYNYTERVCDTMLTSQYHYLANASLTNSSVTRDLCSMVWQGEGVNFVKAQSAFFDTFQPTPQWNDSGLGAATCVLNPCVKQYTAQIRTGRLTETNTANINMTYFGSETSFENGTTNFPYETTVHVPCLTDQERTSLIAAGYTLSSATEWLPFNGTNYGIWNSTLGKYVGYPHGNLTINTTCIFRFLVTADMSLDYWLSSFLNGMVNVTQNGEWQDPSGPGQIQALYNFGRPLTFSRVESYFTGIADSITTAIREYNRTDVYAFPPSYQADAVGVVLENLTCVYVTWQWIVLPATLILLTAIFLVGSIVACPAPYTNRLWKSSILASMFHPLDVKDDIAALIRSDRADDLVEMEKVAKKVTVQLHDDHEGGIKFRNANASRVSLASSRNDGVT